MQRHRRRGGANRAYKEGDTTGRINSGLDGRVWLGGGKGQRK